MPIKGSKAQHIKKGYIGQVSKNIKILSEKNNKIIEQKESILQLQNELHHIDIESKELAKVVYNKKDIVRQQKKKLSELDEEIGQNRSKIKSLGKKRKSVAFQISLSTCKKRKNKPTTSETPHMAKCIRRSETLQACNAIHGGNKTNITPTVVGMIDTLTSHCKSDDLSERLLNCKSSVVNSINQKVHANWSKNFNKSNENLLRSLNVYYSHNVMGKEKYRNIRKANRHAVFDKKSVPNFVPYSTLSKYISEVDIGELFDISSELSSGLTEGEIGSGMYRSCDQYAQRLAAFYLHVDQYRTDKLKYFTFPTKDPESKLFVMSLGGDGAPISGTIFLLSFLNVGIRIASSSENFTIFGANVSESSKLVRRYILKLLSDIKFLESKVFNIDLGGQSYKVEFKLGEMPNDMKMLAFLAGELSNAAYYFSTFANVNKKDSNNYSKCIGPNKDDWKLWDYDKRLQDSAKVSKKIKDLEKSKSNANTQRSNLTLYMSQVLESRQEEKPLVGEYINRAKCEPLHLKNNCVKELFMKVFKICLSQSNLQKCKTYKEIPESSVIVKFLAFVKGEMGCNFLANKIITWYNESCGKTEKEFSFRFRGKESFAYLKHFDELIYKLLCNVSAEQVKFRLHQIFHQSNLLRKVVSYSVRIESFNEEILHEMIRSCQDLFKACCLFDQRISPSLWTLCNAAPYHSNITLQEYGFGLGCNTMEGREQKHQRIKKYADNTTYQCRWPLIFRHEFIQLIHLRESGFDTLNYRKRGSKYLPDRIKGSCDNCFSFSLMKQNVCKVCDSTYMAKVLSDLRKF